MSEPQGQILPGSRFGDILTVLAREAATIVEIGTWRGQGSTRCLANGLVRPEQRMWSLDTSLDMIHQARQGYSDPRITFIHGRVIRPEEMEIDKAPTDREKLALFYGEREALAQSPYVLDQIPESIDLLLLDGGEYTSIAERKVLEPRTKIMALDDCLQSRAWKNYRNYMHFMNNGWVRLVDGMDDRNGWFVFQRPAA